MNLVLRCCSDTLRNVAEERESCQLLDVTDFHILPLRTAILVIKQISSTHGRDSLSTGEMYSHDTLEVLRRYRTVMTVPVRRSLIIIVKNRSGNDIQSIAAARSTTDVLDIPFQRRPNPAIKSAQLRSSCGG